MRFICTLLLLFGALNFTVAQTDEEAIRTTLIDHYFDLLGQKKISEALDYVHPDLINLLGKEMFVNQYKQMFNAPGMDITMDNFAVDPVSATHVHEDVKYALVGYGFKMTFVVDMSDDEDNLLHGILLGTYKRQFGADNVTSPKEGTYDIQVNREMFAVSDAKFEGWKILDFEEGMRVFLKGIIPEAVFTHFKK